MNRQAPGAAAARDTMKHAKILIADDEAAITTGLAAILEDAGYAVDVVADGQKALDKLVAERYVEYYAHQRSFRACIFRMSTVYAPPSEGNAPSFVGSYAEAIDKGESIALPGLRLGGEQLENLALAEAAIGGAIHLRQEFESERLKRIPREGETLRGAMVEGGREAPSDHAGIVASAAADGAGGGLVGPVLPVKRQRRAARGEGPDKGTAPDGVAAGIGNVEKRSISRKADCPGGDSGAHHSFHMPSRTAMPTSSNASTPRIAHSTRAFQALVLASRHACSRSRSSTTSP